MAAKHVMMRILCADVKMRYRNYLFPIIVIFTACVMTVCNPDYVEAAESSGELKIMVEGLKSDAGKVRIGLFDTPEAYHSKSNQFRGAALEIKDRKCVWVVEEVPYGEYAVIVHHDQNGNKEMDYKFLKIPREPYGFSKNVPVRLKMPAWNKVKFTLDTKSKTIKIRVD